MTYQLPDRPKAHAQGRIISVYHTGTRTLQEYLRLSAYWHFGQNQPDIDRYTETAHIPIRDPFDTSVSWLQRYPSDPERSQAILQKLLDLMCAYCLMHPATVTVYRIEDIAQRHGEFQGPKHWARDRRRRKDALSIDRIRELRAWIVEQRRLEFFQHYYPEGFWWIS